MLMRLLFRLKDVACHHFRKTTQTNSGKPKVLWLILRLYSECRKVKEWRQELAEIEKLAFRFRGKHRASSQAGDRRSDHVKHGSAVLI